MRKFVIVVLITLGSPSSPFAAPGDATRGERDFRGARRAIPSNPTET